MKQRSSSPLGATVVLAVLLLHSPTFAQGIPVIDQSSIAAQATQHAEALAKYIEQIATLKQQLDQAVRQYEAFTGPRNLGDIFSNPAIRKSLPPDLRSVLENTGDSYARIQTAMKRIEKEQVLSGNYLMDRKSIQERIDGLAVRTKALLEQVQEGQQERLAQIDQLQAQINASTDPKAIADLQARLQVEQANILVDEIRVNLLNQELAAEKQLIERQAAALTRKSSLSIEAIRAPIPEVR